MIVVNRRMERRRPAFDAHLERVNRDLAAALAQDRGWDPETLEAAARSAWSERRPGVEPEEVRLHEVLDRPGTDQDKAIYRIRSGDRDALLTLGRRDGEWVCEELQ